MDKTIINGLIDDAVFPRVNRRKPELLPTGSLCFDVAMSGGLPFGSIVEFTGDKSTGKTAMLLSMIAQTQKLDKTSILIDNTHDLNVDFADTLGVSITELLLAQPESVKEMMDMITALVESGEIDAIFVDSITSLIYESDGSADLKWAAIENFLQRMSNRVRENNCILIFTSQLRKSRRRGKVVTGTSGGSALAKLANIRVLFEKNGNIRELYDIIGNTLRLSIIKNAGRPLPESFDINVLYNIGIEHVQEVIDMGIKHGFIEKSGAWYKYGDVQKHGIIEFKEYLRENPEIIEEIEKYIQQGS